MVVALKSPVMMKTNGFLSLIFDMSMSKLEPYSSNYWEMVFVTNCYTTKLCIRWVITSHQSATIYVSPIINVFDG